MMNQGEINALLRLLEDPDMEIYQTVSERLKSYGHTILPKLESSWQSSTDPIVSTRIENIIRHVTFKHLIQEFAEWYSAKKPDLLQGCLLLGRFFQHNADDNGFIKLIKSIHQSCWLELNQYFTPLEQVNVINSIFYSYYKFKGFDPEKMQPNHFDIQKVAESREGNNYSLGMIYQLLCEMLDVPVYFIQLPQHALLAYFNPEFNFRDKDAGARQKIQFYIDANNGMLYTQNDVEAYIKKYKLQIESYHFNPLSNTDIMTHTLQALLVVYEALDHDERQIELRQLLQIARGI